MKIAIVTPHGVYNYGAVLQAFGLYSYLSNLENDVFMYDFAPRICDHPHGVKESIYVFANKVGRMIHHAEIKKGEYLFDDFIKQFNLTNEVDLSLYIVGSDQVWNPNNLDSVFSLSFVSESSRTASYAASLGISTVPKEKEEIFKRAIDKIESLSAREVSTADEVKRITGRTCHIDVDPSFLLEKDRWRTEENNVCVKKPYILLYLLHIPKNIKEIISETKKRFGCDVIFIDRTGFIRYGFPNVIGRGDIGPREFLWLIDNASYVVTSSFHGTAFSIIFEKQFRSIINSNSPSRISHLLHITSIDTMEDEINYEMVWEQLNPYIESSKEYLKEVVRMVK